MSASSASPVSVDPCLLGGGEAGALMRSIDWSKSALGPVGKWPTTLRTSVGIMLASTFAMRILWGPKLIMLHNRSRDWRCGQYRSISAPVLIPSP